MKMQLYPIILWVPKLINIQEIASILETRVSIDINSPFWNTLLQTTWRLFLRMISRNSKIWLVHFRGRWDFRHSLCIMNAPQAPNSDWLLANSFAGTLERGEGLRDHPIALHFPALSMLSLLTIDPNTLFFSLKDIVTSNDAAKEIYCIV